MKFRPCIDIHNGKVKQIVGGSLLDEKNHAEENFVSEKDASWFAGMYAEKDIKGGHIILLNPPASEFYEETKRQAMAALNAYPKGLQIGGGITAENAAEYLEAGASHIIVTSYIFKNGIINYKNLEKLKKEIGIKHIVIDLSCRKRGEEYYIVTDRWQNYTQTILSEETLDFFAGFCDEFLVHAVDVEGKAGGIEKQVAKLLGSWGKKPVTYAGGVHSFEDLEELKTLGKEKVDVTIGSALNLFGGNMKFEEVLAYMNKKRTNQ